ncbi:sigma-54-dependent transcriptional regulator [Rheinheimera marina]|uniref:Sigma-54-dependent transcriptional regulator n=1 Tax=Rheinheimera marina TaxID=1774958 RepID=A0ABV9JGL9_9GAMM
MNNLLWIDASVPAEEQLNCARAEGLQIRTARDLTSVLDACSSLRPDIVVMASQLPDIETRELMRVLKRHFDSCQIIVLVERDQHAFAAECLTQGAIDYLLKPFSAVQLQNTIRHAASVGRGLKDMVAVSVGSRQVLQLANRAAQTDATVLLNGESGTGKERLAQYIHQVSARRDQPYIAVNCAAIPENMLEAMLFGYNKGAFTGATQNQIGKFEAANGGTLLLDEISELPLPLQAKLLRVLQERELERLGSNQKIKLNVRVIAASNKDLRALAEQGQFRQDLFYRLDVLPLRWPALRERRDDIIPMAEFFMQKYGDGKYLLSPAAQQQLLAYSWPGNVRELENVMQRALVMARGIELQPIDLSLPAQVLTAAELPVSAEQLKHSKRTAEFDYVLGVLNQFNGHRTRAAAALGVSTRALRYKLAAMREHGVDTDAIA